MRTRPGSIPSNHHYATAADPQVMTMQRSSPTHIRVHGIALELSQGAHHALLSTRDGIQGLLRLLIDMRPYLLIVRRCNTLQWVTQFLYGCKDQQQGCRPSPRQLSLSSVEAQARMHDESDRALRKLAFSTGCPRLYLNYEWLQEESGAHMVRRMLTTFLGIELPSGFSVTHDINESGTPAVLLPGAACDQQPPECNETADSGCDLHDGIGPLVSYSRMRFPMLAVGVHSDSGGAAFMAKVMAQACKVWLTPRLGIRCSFRDNYDACDSAQADLCFHGQARISTGAIPSHICLICVPARDSYPLTFALREVLRAGLPFCPYSERPSRSCHAQLPRFFPQYDGEYLIDFPGLRRAHTKAVGRRFE